MTSKLIELKETLRIFVSLVISSAWKFIFSILLSIIYPLITIYRDEFLTPNESEKYRIGRLIERIDWYYWVIPGLLLFFTWSLWDASRKLAKFEPIEVISSLEFSTLKLSFAVKNGYGYASILINNLGKYDINEFYGVISGIEILQCTNEEITHQNRKNGLEKREWINKGIDYINPNRLPIVNQKNNSSVTLNGFGGVERFDIARYKNDGKGVYIIHQKEERHISGSKTHKNEALIEITFYGKTRNKNIIPFTKLFKLCFSYSHTTGMQIDKFETCDVKRT